VDATHCDFETPQRVRDHRRVAVPISQGIRHEDHLTRARQRAVDRLERVVKETSTCNPIAGQQQYPLRVLHGWNPLSFETRHLSADLEATLRVDHNGAET
jgi:hypothetical protein